MKKKLKFRKPYSKKNIVNDKNLLKKRINEAGPSELEGLKKAFDYYDNVFKGIAYEDEVEYYLFRLIMYKLKRMQAALKNSEYYWYEKYGLSLDRAIKVLDIYLKDEFYYDGYVNIKNASRFFPNMSEETIKKFFDKDWKPDIENSEILSNTDIDMFNARCSDLRKEKAFHLFIFILENFSRHWWI